MPMNQTIKNTFQATVLSKNYKKVIESYYNSQFSEQHPESNSRYEVNERTIDYFQSN